MSTEKPVRRDDAVLRTLQARLDRQALQQLREVATRQADRIEALQQELERALQLQASAEEHADFWHEQTHSLEQQLHELSPGHSVGMTQTGALMVIPTPGVAA